MGEYNTIDLGEENTKKKITFVIEKKIFEMQHKGPSSSHHSGSTSDGVHKMAEVYAQHFRRITWTMSELHDI